MTDTKTKTVNQPLSFSQSVIKGRWQSLIIFMMFMALVLYATGVTRSIGVWLGATATGLSMGLVAIGVYISFRILDFPDLTIDGSFTLGAAVTATMLVNGADPYATLPAAFVVGVLAGIATALIATGLNIHSLLASIITTTALISINLRIMGRSNVPLLNTDTIFTPFAASFRAFVIEQWGEEWGRSASNILTILFVGLIVLLIKWLFDWFMHTELGLALQATGDNPQMVRSLGRNTNVLVVLGIALSNGFVGISGSIFAQNQGFSDVNMGVGLIIAGLAAVILGETFFRPRTVAGATLAVVLGMIVYRIAIAAALSVKVPLPDGASFRIDAQDVKLATAVMVLISLWVTNWQKKRKQ